MSSLQSLTDTQSSTNAPSISATGSSTSAINTNTDMPEMIDLIDTAPVKRIDLYNGLGFVELIDMMPRRVPVGRTADIAITRNARVSYAITKDKTPAEDAGLVRYLLENWHTSPSESVEFQFRIRLPIFVERQLIRHRTANVNEESARYTKAKDNFYFPDLRMQSADNKQGSSNLEVPAEATALWDNAKDLTRQLYQSYSQMIELGVAKEVARCCLPVNMCTSICWKMDLHNLLNFLRLRMDVHAQQEIRELANAIFTLISPLVPVSIAAFQDCRLNSISFSQSEQEYCQGSKTMPAHKKAAYNKKIEKLIPIAVAKTASDYIE